MKSPVLLSSRRFGDIYVDADAVVAVQHYNGPVTDEAMLVVYLSGLSNFDRLVDDTPENRLRLNLPEKSS
jgi:hypothetical protein